MVVFDMGLEVFSVTETPEAPIDRTFPPTPVSLSFVLKPFVAPCKELVGGEALGESAHVWTEVSVDMFPKSISTRTRKRWVDILPCPPALYRVNHEAEWAFKMLATFCLFWQRRYLQLMLAISVS